jgi:spore coat protein CotF
MRYFFTSILSIGLISLTFSPIAGATLSTKKTISGERMIKTKDTTISLKKILSKQIQDLKKEHALTI